MIVIIGTPRRYSSSKNIQAAEKLYGKADELLGTDKHVRRGTGSRVDPRQWGFLYLDAKQEALGRDLN